MTKEGELKSCKAATFIIGFDSAQPDSHTFSIGLQFFNSLIFLILPATSPNFSNLPILFNNLKHLTKP
jgi:hypothetical protein